MGPSVKQWPTILRFQTGPVVNLPADPKALLRALGRHVRTQLSASCLLTTLAMGTQAVFPWALGLLLDSGLEDGLTAHLIFPLAVLAGLTALNALAEGLQEMAEISAWSSSLTALRSVGERLAHNGRAIKATMPSGDISAAILTDIDAIGVGAIFFSQFIAALLSTVLVVVLMVTVSIKLALVVIIGLPLVLLGVSAVIRPLEQKLSVLRDEEGKLTNIATDLVSGLRVLRGIGGERTFAKLYRRQSAEVKNAGIRVAPAPALLNMLRQASPAVLAALVMGYGAVLTFDGEITIGQLVAFYGYTWFLSGPLWAITMALQRFTRAWVGIKKLAGIMAVLPLASDAQVPDSSDGSDSDASSAPSAAITWSRAALRDGVSDIVVQPGRMTALVCADPDVSARLARRLGRVSDAHDLWVDDRDAHTIPLREFRRKVLLCDAEAQLFSGSLRSALQAAAATDRRTRGTTEIVHSDVVMSASREEHGYLLEQDDTEDSRWMNALHIADAHDVLLSLPAGLDGLIAEQGRSLSGGQRQRVALARAIASEPPVMVLIEPTSAVDSHTEARIARRLAEHRAGMTTIVASASPLILDVCDDIVLMSEQGQELAHGSREHFHQAALAHDPMAQMLRQIVSRQAGEDR